jgi:death-on-curing protein
VKGEPCWISKAAALAIHEALLSEHGGAAGLRDEGLLEAALSSPKQNFHYKKADIFTLAAAYANALIRDHPFHYGNKRIALTLAGTFLEMNGHRLRAPEPAAVQATVALAERKLDPGAYAAWLRSESVPLRSLKGRRTPVRKTRSPR